MSEVKLTIHNKVILVIAGTTGGILETTEDIKEARVVEPNNLKQLNSAREWCSSYITGVMETRTKIDPPEIFTDNNNFKVKLLGKNCMSYQGSNIPLCKCLVEKEDEGGQYIKVIMSLDLSNLMSILSQSTVINGEIQERVSLVKTGGFVGVVHKGMDEWKTAMQKDKGEKVSKTTKWQLGKSYTTITMEDVYIAELYNWFEVTSETVIEDTGGNNSFGRYRTVENSHLKLLDVPVKNYALLNLRGYDWDASKGIKVGKITKLSEIYQEALKRLREGDMNSIYKLEAGLPFLSYNNKPLSKLASRQQGEISLEVDEYIPILDEALKLYREAAFNFYSIQRDKNMAMGVSMAIKALSYTTSSKKRPSFSEEEKELILNLSSRCLHFDFGDGIELTGRRR